MDELRERRLKLQTYQNTELVEGLGWALDQAINGKITGACFVLKHGRFQHTIGVLGKYKDDPYCAMQATRKLRKILKEDAKKMEEEVYLEHTY